MIQRYPNGRSYAEDLCERVTYSYDTNPLNPSFSLNSTGRLTVAQYGSNTLSASCVPGVNPTQLAEMYSYHPAGAVTAKRLQITRQGYDQYSKAMLNNNLYKLPGGPRRFKCEARGCSSSLDAFCGA
jgi:hypothetical protein